MTSLATSELDVTRSDEIVVDTNYGRVPLLCVKSGDNELFRRKTPRRWHYTSSFHKSPCQHNGISECWCRIHSRNMLGRTIPQDFPPGSVGYAHQYIDFSGVESTFSNEDAKFTSMTEPFDVEMNKKLIQYCCSYNQVSN